MPQASWRRWAALAGAAIAPGAALDSGTPRPEDKTTALAVALAASTCLTKERRLKVGAPDLVGGPLGASPLFLLLPVSENESVAGSPALESARSIFIRFIGYLLRLKALSPWLLNSLIKL